MEERIFDYTALDTFLTCRRKYYWMMIRNLRSQYVAPALDFGGALHTALAAYYASGLESALKVFKEVYKDREGDDLRTVANGEKLLCTYADKYRSEPFKVIEGGGKPALEIGFIVPMGDVMYAGRLDALVDWSGQLFVLEHKSTASMQSNYFKQFSPNMQVDGYIYGAAAYTGRKCHGCIINAMEVWKDVKRPTERTKKPEDHFARDPQTRTEAELEDFANQVNSIVEDVLYCEELMGEEKIKDAFYQNKHSCMNYRYDCPYRQLCLYGENERIIENDYVKDKWEPYKEAVVETSE